MLKRQCRSLELDFCCEAIPIAIPFCCDSPRRRLLVVSLRTTDIQMTLAAILAVSLLSQTGSPQAAPAQPPATTQPAQDSATQPKPAPKPHHRKKPSAPNCPAAAPSSTSAENSASSTPCPPPKKVVRNGGSDEPPVQFSGGTAADQAMHERSTGQLTSATEENLKKITGLQLNPSQQEMVSQIKQYMEQSKSAAADGDLDRAHNLAMKAHLLSDELVKP
jgi:hypothetical protein